MREELNYNEKTFFKTLSERFLNLLKEKHIEGEEVSVHAKSLTAKEAIGDTKRKDYPILTGKDIMIEADINGSKGQAFTDSPSRFTGTLLEVCSLDLDDNSYNRAIFIAVLNATMKYLGLIECTVHCKNKGPEICGQKVLEHLKNTYGDIRISIFGYQPSLLESLSGNFKVRICDLNPDNIGEIREGVMVENGGDVNVMKDMAENSDLLLVTGSTICNGSIVNFIPYKEKTLFYGTTLAGAAYLMNLPRICYTDELQD